MLQHALKIGLILVALGIGAQNASAFGRFGCGWCGPCCPPVCCAPVCGWGGCYAYGGVGYGGYAYAGYGGWGYAGVGYGGAYLASAGGACASPAAPATATPPVKAARADTSSVLLAVNVPADAKVFINGHETTSTGERREYKSNNLKATETYAYRVRAEFVRDGKPVSEEQTVQLSPGQIGSFAFTTTPGAQVADMATAARR